jgi:hypothetical protein
MAESTADKVKRMKKKHGFDAVNKPKRTPDGPKKFAVLALTALGAVELRARTVSCLRIFGPERSGIVKMADKHKLPLTEKQEAFLQALTNEAQGDIRAAMRVAGYSDSTKTSEVVNNLREEIIERTQTMLAVNAPKAAAGLLGVLNDPSAMGARNAVSAASQILDRVGVVKKEQVEVESKGNAMFILPPKTSEPNDYGNTDDVGE